MWLSTYTQHKQKTHQPKINGSASKELSKKKCC